MKRATAKLSIAEIGMEFEVVGQVQCGRTMEVRGIALSPGEIVSVRITHEDGRVEYHNATVISAKRLA